MYFEIKYYFNQQGTIYLNPNLWRVTLSIIYWDIKHGEDLGLLN